MREVAALLAVALLGVGAGACGGGGAEPGAPRGATLVLDFQPNAVHSGIYPAQANGYFEDEGVDLTIREPSSTADSAKLLESGRAELAIMDINDFGIARERGAALVPIAAIVQRPLASVIAGDRETIRTPADLAGKTIGVTGVPSDDAVLDTVLRSGGVDPSNVRRVTIGFNAVSALAAGRVDAATAFWNAEGVQLEQMDIPIRKFRIDQFGAPRYPELLLVARPDTAADPLAERVRRGLDRGYRVLGRNPQAALGDLLASVDGLDGDAQRAQLDALVSSNAFAQGEAAATPELPAGAIDRWMRWASAAGLLGGS
jgi:putative hydroxymethylpyrimidine transport system substrate-binding protein